MLFVLVKNANIVFVFWRYVIYDFNTIIYLNILLYNMIMF